MQHLLQPYLESSSAADFRNMFLYMWNCCNICFSCVWCICVVHHDVSHCFKATDNLTETFLVHVPSTYMEEAGVLYCIHQGAVQIFFGFHFILLSFCPSLFTVYGKKINSNTVLKTLSSKNKLQKVPSSLDVFMMSCLVATGTRWDTWTTCVRHSQCVGG